MKIITDLTAQSAEGEHRESRGFLTSVHDESKPGVLRQVSLGADGLVFKRANVRAAIPLAALWKLADEHEPALKG